MIIPRDIRDWGVYMGSEPQVFQEGRIMSTSRLQPPQDTVVRDIGVRVMNELVQPFKAIQMDDTELENYSESSSEKILGFPCFSLLPVWD